MNGTLLTQGEAGVPNMSITIDRLAYHPSPLCHLIDIQYRDLIFSNTMVVVICVGSLIMKLGAPHTNEKPIIFWSKS